jgi:5-formyltetrahydrofolate cyclo-ligase
MTKPQARQQMKAILAAIPAREAARRSRRAVERLMSTRWWRESDVVLTYLPMPGELDTFPLVSAALSQGKVVAAPVIDGLDLAFRLVRAPAEATRRDRLGIPQPDPAAPPWAPGEGGRVLVVTPGIAFDPGRNRLGRGMGFYDRFIAGLRGRPHLAVSAVAVAFDEQVMDEVPFDDRDVPLDGIVTDARVIGP